MRDIHSLAPGLIPGAGVHGREDNHVQACAGRAYGSIEDALEALTMEMQESFDPV